MWKGRDIFFTITYSLFRSIVLYIFQCGYETWILLTDVDKKWELIHICYTERETSEYVRNKVLPPQERHEPLLATVKRRELFQHVE